MDLVAFVAQWKGQEVVAFCGPVKYRGTLESTVENQFLVLSKVAIVNTSVNEMAEYETCMLNMSQVSGLANMEIVGRGGEDVYEQ